MSWKGCLLSLAFPLSVLVIGSWHLAGFDFVLHRSQRYLVPLKLQALNTVKFLLGPVPLASGSSLG